MPADYGIRWDLGDVKACSAHHNIEFVKLAVGCAYTVAFYAGDV
jgi:hypothetical protein